MSAESSAGPSAGTGEARGVQGLSTAALLAAAAERTRALPGWSLERMTALGTRHSSAEAVGDLEAVLDTLGADPYYEFHPHGLCMRGGDRARRFYEHFVARFLPLRHDFQLIDEWVNETSVAQEYVVGLSVDGVVESHRVLGVLFADGERLGGERVFASERFVRLLIGPVFDELEPIA